ncbi:SDR family NAD(P)-dependent oxidoreductase [Hymenobacter profundi]|uniref:SDR family NAD(P)-dependent oxidoreductase n=1 Tax=Hymenobacter profundi TaxID=1982110 RepID=A0ABS6WUC1_9BACT|nr:SDR family NAD(P)-dependent oxidoreductase [Hymenobacter profundi]MBW3127175.1 SDR family NAD(P)-dependent oxidoreductase [Hymenobacter profundi]
MNEQKVWLVTGASKGLGLALVKKLLLQGYQVAATSREASQLQQAVGEHSNFLALAADLSQEESVKTALAQVVARFGQLDVVVNNAGYGLQGSLEEVPLADLQQCVEVNVYGTLCVIRQALPYLRAQRSGHIFNLSSIAGYAAEAGFGAYNIAKYAVVGLSETLAAEVSPFGIRVTVVGPGAFRTNFFSPGSFVYSEGTIADYEPLHALRAKLDAEVDQKQPGDPDKAADVLIRAAESDAPPLYLMLGADAYEKVAQKQARFAQDLSTWKDQALATAIIH